MKKKPTALQLFKQHKKIQELKQRLSREETLLRQMISQADGLPHMLREGEEIYKITPIKTCGSFNNRLEVEHIGSAETLKQIAG